MKSWIGTGVDAPTTILRTGTSQRTTTIGSTPRLTTPTRPKEKATRSIPRLKTSQCQPSEGRGRGAVTALAPESPTEQATTTRTVGSWVVLSAGARSGPFRSAVKSPRNLCAVNAAASKSCKETIEGRAETVMAVSITSEPGRLSCPVLAATKTCKQTMSLATSSSSNSLCLATRPRARRQQGSETSTTLEKALSTSALSQASKPSRTNRRTW